MNFIIRYKCGRHGSCKRCLVPLFHTMPVASKSNAPALMSYMITDLSFSYGCWWRDRSMSWIQSIAQSSAQHMVSSGRKKCQITTQLREIDLQFGHRMELIHSIRRKEEVFTEEYNWLSSKDDGLLPLERLYYLNMTLTTWSYSIYRGGRLTTSVMHILSLNLRTKQVIWNISKTCPISTLSFDLCVTVNKSVVVDSYLDSENRWSILAYIRYLLLSETPLLVQMGS